MLARLAYHAGHSEPMLPPEGGKAKHRVEK